MKVRVFSCVPLAARRVHQYPSMDNLTDLELATALYTAWLRAYERDRGAVLTPDERIAAFPFTDLTTAEQGRWLAAAREARHIAAGK